MKVGFTGTQLGMTQRQMDLLWEELSGASEFHHGDCIGADEQAHAIAARRGIPIVIHPPNISSKRAFCEGTRWMPERDYLKRNHLIVDHTDRLVGCPKNRREELRSGTWATIRYAKKIGKNYVVLLP